MNKLLINNFSILKESIQKISSKKLLAQDILHKMWVNCFSLCIEILVMLILMESVS